MRPLSVSGALPSLMMVYWVPSQATLVFLFSVFTLEVRTASVFTSLPSLNSEVIALSTVTGNSIVTETLLLSVSVAALPFTVLVAVISPIFLSPISTSRLMVWAVAAREKSRIKDKQYFILKVVFDCYNFFA